LARKVHSFTYLAGSLRERRTRPLGQGVRFVAAELRLSRGSRNCRRHALWPTCYSRVIATTTLSANISPSSHHTPHRSTNLSQWPLNVFLTSSPTSPRARLRSIKCTHPDTPSPHLSPDRFHSQRNVHVLLTLYLSQYLPKPRRCCHHTRDQNTSHQGRQGRLQGYSSRWPSVQDPRAGCPQEQARPTDG
jgi:hypothetical protein